MVIWSESNNNLKGKNIFTHTFATVIQSKNETFVPSLEEAGDLICMILPGFPIDTFLIISTFSYDNF